MYQIESMLLARRANSIRLTIADTQGNAGHLIIVNNLANKRLKKSPN